MLAALTSLAGCVTAPSDGGAVAVCPTLKTYPAADQASAADELDALPAGAELRVMMRDYAGLRDQVRACRAK